MCDKETSTRSFTESNPCTCELDVDDGELSLYGRIALSNARVKYAEAFVFNHRTQDGANIFHTCSLREPWICRVSWANKTRLGSPGVKKWADCNKRKERSLSVPSSARQEDPVPGCMVDVGDNLINDVGKAHNQQCQATVSAGILAASEYTIVHLYPARGDSQDPQGRV